MNVNEFPPGSFSLRNILVSRTSEHYQHGGPNAPPINRVLGIGAHFLIRELYRNGILTHDGGHGLCYVPTSGVKRVIEALGCSSIKEKVSWEIRNEEKSKVIFHFLRDNLDSATATFKKDFDIPFQIISEDIDLQKDFFDKVFPKQQPHTNEER
jgi:hypothetical protein